MNQSLSSIDSKAPPSRCFACGRGLDGVPLAARFCPSCGVEIRAEVLATARPVQSKLAIALPIWMWTRLQRFYQIDDESGDFGPPGLAYSLMAAGYASAMFRLGWRYENGRNAREALRCYCKAARLGNAEAMARVSPEWK